MSAPNGPITEAQVVEFLRAKCAEMRAKAGADLYVFLRAEMTVYANGDDRHEWVAYYNDGQHESAKNVDDAIAEALDDVCPVRRTNQLRAEIESKRIELAQLEGAK
jgi:hypothetical protein